jgi:cell division protease FtsH
MSPVVRTVLFWVMMIALAVVLWQMSSKPTSQKPSSAISYSDFMIQVDKHNVGSAKLLVSQSTAQIQGQLRTPPENFSVTIPKEVIPDLTERLRKQGATVEVAEIKDTNLINTLINFSPILLIVGVWIFMMRQRSAMRKQPPADNPSSGPIG